MWVCFLQLCVLFLYIDFILNSVLWTCTNPISKPPHPLTLWKIENMPIFTLYMDTPNILVVIIPRSDGQWKIKAWSRPPHARIRGVWKRSKMGLGWMTLTNTFWSIHLHKLIIKQCKWLVQRNQIRPQTCFEITLGSHDLDLKGSTTYLPIMYFKVFHGDYIQMIKVLGSPKMDSLTWGA
jgi:hypothetical protein